MTSVLHDFHMSLRFSIAGECFVMIALAICWMLNVFCCMFYGRLCMRMIREEFVQCFVPYFLNAACFACFWQVEMAQRTFKRMLQQK